MTNGDRIRQMSNEELAGLIAGSPCYFCLYEHGDDECIVHMCKRSIKAYLESEEQ